MIHAIEIENFRSFDKLVRIEFTAKPEKAGTHGYSKLLPSGAVVSKLAVFVGANASGKSNILKAITLIGWLISKSAETNQNGHEYLVPFIDRTDAPSFLAIEFCDGQEELFRYEVTLGANLFFHEEKLSVRQTSRAQTRILFHRLLNKQSILKFKDTNEADWGLIPQRANASLIGSMILSGKRPNAESNAYDICQRIYNFARNGLHKISPEFDVGTMLSWGRIGKLLYDDKDLLKKASDFIQYADIGAIRLETGKNQFANTVTGEERTTYFPVVVHSINGKDVKMDFRLESSGTRKILHLFSEARPVAEKSGILVLDEIEEGIHPHLLPILVDAFVSTGETSQTIIATHCDHLLRHIEHDQVYITEKDDKGATDAYKASDMEGFKADRNLQGWYHAGKLGGIPRL